MIAHCIRRQEKKRRPGPRRLATSIVALSAYVLDADPALLIRAEGIEHLTGYALDRELRELGVQSGEKVLAYGARNLRGSDTKSWQAQMIATALGCRRSKKPLEHIILSWRPGETPGRRQMKEAVDLVATTLGAGRNQIIWAAHSNTENIHIHIIINRIDPMTHRATQLGDGWDHDRLMQAVALIECRQGWQRETLAPYVANDLGEVRKITDGTKVRSADGTQLIRKGDRAAELADWRRRADIAALAHTMTHAEDWPGLHAGFAQHHAKLIEKGPGAVVILADGHEHRASRFGTGCKLSAIEARLGSYQPPAADQRSHDEFKAHQAQIAALHRRTSDDRAARLLALKLAEDAYRAQIRRTIAGCAQRFAVEAELKQEFAAANAAMRAAYDGCFAAIGAARLTPSDWAKGRRHPIPEVPLPSFVVPLPGNEKRFVAAEGYAVHHTGSATTYARGGRAAFVDYRVCIIVLSQRDDDVLAVLRMAEARWGDKTVITGDPEFHAQCARLAAAHGLEIYPPATTASVVPGELEPALPGKLSLDAETISTSPFVFTTPSTLAAMKDLVRKRGYDVGMTGEVRYDRTAKAFRIDGSVPDNVRRELETVLAPYMTEDARRRARSLQYEHQSAMKSNDDAWTHINEVRQARATVDIRAWPSLTDAEDPTGTWQGWAPDAGSAATMAANSFTDALAALDGEQNNKTEGGDNQRLMNEIDIALPAAPMAPRPRVTPSRSREELELALQWRAAFTQARPPEPIAPRTVNAPFVAAQASDIATPLVPVGSGAGAGVASARESDARLSSRETPPLIVAAPATAIGNTRVNRAPPSNPDKASESQIRAPATSEAGPPTTALPTTVARDADGDKLNRQLSLQAQAAARSAGR